MLTADFLNENENHIKCIKNALEEGYHTRILCVYQFSILNCYKIMICLLFVETAQVCYKARESSMMKLIAK